MNPRLGDGYRLLFHDLVNRDAITRGHFIEFVDADDATISKDNCASL